MSGRADQDFTAVVVAAGLSARFGDGRPKQFQDLAGRTVLERSVASLAGRPRVRGVVVVVAPEYLDGPEAASARQWPGVLDVVAGGSTRARSVVRGVAATGSSPFVLVHDAARPLAGPELVDAVIDATAKHGAAVPVLEIFDTVKQCDPGGWVTGTIDRATLRRVQTPQGFRRDWLERALERAQEDRVELTDEAAAVERDGRRVAAVSGDEANLKITTPADLARARAGLSSEPPGLRVGTGFDIHRRGGPGPLVLGGVQFPGEPGLEGHSDADVVLHAAMDALLGAAGLGDIGVHFPPGDPALAGAASTQLAGRVADLLAQAGIEVVNLDLTLLAEAPRIRGRAGEMREAIAACLRLQAVQVSLKATTLEGLGALGRKEGLACQAVALVLVRGVRG